MSERPRHHLAKRPLAFLSAERGATAVEYALLVSLIAAVVVTAVILFGDNVFGLFDFTNDSRW